MGKNRYNLTFPQENILLMERYNKDSSVNVITGLINIDRDFDEKSCNRALNELIKANDALRTKVFEESGEFFQEFSEYEYEEFEVIDMSSNSKYEILEYIDDLASQSLFAYNKKLYDFKILKYSSDTGSIFMRSHHIISDAWSCSKIGNQLINYLENKAESLEENNIPSYIEFITAENEYKISEKFAKDSEFWKEYLNGVTETVSLKDKKSNISSKANRYSVKLEEKINDNILKYCKENRVSPYALFLAAFSTYIYRIKDKNDFVLGTPVLNRANFKEKQMLGMFVSTLPLRIKINEGENFLELVKNIGKDTLSVFRHQKYPYMKTLEYVRKNTNITSNLYSMVLSYQNARVDMVDETKYSTSWAFAKELEDDLQIHIMDMDDSGILNINYDYRTELFENIEIEYLHTRIMAIIENAIADLEINIEDIRIMSKEEENKILYEFNDTKRDYLKDKTVIDLFEEQVEKNPDNIALVFEDMTMTYKELNEKANQLAHFLLEEKNVKPNDVVGIILKRGFEIIISILGILKSGAAYLPIDPEYPEDRINYMLDNSNAKIVLCKENLDNILLKINENSDLKLKIQSEELAYILYTSGSTGKPKGVMVKRRGLDNISKYFLGHSVYDGVNTILSITTVSFDIFVFDTITSLINGVKIVISNEEEQRNPNLMNILIENNSVDLIQSTPTRFKQLLDNIKHIPKLDILKKVVLSGEKVPFKLKEDILKLGVLEVYNGYGPTENTVFSSFTNCTNEENISIGIPIDNTNFYILDKKNRLLPLNIEGELFVAGENLANGYVNNPTLTNDTFFTLNDENVYKTGDICRIGFDKKNYCIGRIDNQVKINGIRIELDEISGVINNYNGVINNVVVYKKINEKKILVDYFISENNNLDVQSLRQYVSEKLPRYMHPVKYIRLEELPLTPNGKIDRKKLESIVDIKQNYNESKVEIVTNVQNDIIDIVCRLLELNKIGVEENIYQYGLDSLKVIQFSIDLSDHFNVDINVKDLYNCESVLQVEQLIRKCKKKQYNLEQRQAEYPLSNSQFGVFTSYSLNPDSTAYNIPFEMKFNKKIDVDKLKEALLKVTNSTDTLFTKIYIKDGVPFQKIDKSRKINIKINKISEKEYKLEKGKFVKAFDLLNDLLFDINIVLTEKNTYVVINIHHIIFDGLSMNIFLNKLKNAYGNEEIESDEFVIGQFAMYEKNIESTDKYKEAKKYLYNMFSDELPDNNMILDKKRGNERNYSGAKLDLKIDSKLANMILSLANKNNLTLNSIFLSMFNFVLSKYMYSNDIIIGMATSGRDIKEQMNQIGMFVKTIPFRTKINFDSSILEYVKNTQKQVIETIDNSIYPYEKLIKDLNITRDSARNPLFDIMFVYQNSGMPDITFDSENVVLTRINSNTSKFDITFEVMPNKDEFDINIEYSTDLFYEETIKRLGNHYINALKYIVNNSSDRLKDIDILSQDEKDIILKKYNNTTSCYPKNKSVIELFKEQVKKTPKNMAVVFEDNSLTYNELNELSEKLAIHLNELGVKKGDMVALMMDKSLELMVSIIAILKLGAVYVPLELDFPKERIEYILEDTKSKVVLVNKEYNNLEKYEIIDVNLKSDIYNKSIEKNKLNIDYNADDLVYVMYTSGTTGKPKGVMVTNRNIVRLIKNTNYISLKKDDRIIQTGSTAFDATTFEYYVALFNGLPVYLLKKQDLLDMKKFEKYVIDNKITIMFITTQLFNQIVEYKTDLLDSFRVILTGGEAHSLKHIKLVKDRCKNLKLYNVYGPTENTTFSTFYEINSIENNLPIGKPISNTTCYVLDKTGKLCYTNMLGELVTGGDGVSKGYLNNIELTKEKFITDNFLLDGKMYKTGDLTYLDEDGNINFCGRIDTQVKIRGFRIEPDEINQRLNQFAGVKESVVFVEVHNNKKVIVAYYTTANNNVVKESITTYLKEFLPSYMIPSYFIEVDKIPLNNSGKADKRRLFEFSEEYINKNKESKNINLNYEGEYLKVYNLFKEVLENNNIEYDDDFFEIGGDSLLALKLVTNAIAKDIPITYPDLFKYPTIRELGDMLNKASNNKSICEPMYSFDYSKINKVLENNVYSDDIKVYGKLGNVLLTGVTGFLGAHILDEFMKLEKGKIYCLVREKNGKAPLTRLKENLRFFFGDKYDNEIGNRIIVVEENIEERERLNCFEINKNYIKDIDVVINSAACVKHFGNYDVFEKINVDLVKTLIDFCLKYEKKLIQISTLSVSGNLLEAGQLEQSKIQPNTVFNESNLYIEQNLDNVYAYTKYLAEKVVYDAIANNNLNAKVMRMGNLTGRTGDGRFQPNVSENAFANRLKSMIELKVLPINMLDFYLEFTPIDYAAKAVVLLSKVEQKYNTFHLFNHNHAMLYYVDEVLNNKLDLHAQHISKEEMTKLIEKFSKDEDGFEKIKGIVLDVNKNKELDYVSNIKVKSDFTIQVLKKLGFEWLHIDEEYIVKYIGYLFDIGFLTKEEE